MAQTTVPLPRDADRIAMQLTPSTVALSQVINGSISSSSTLAITAGATILRLYSADKDTLLKWGSTAVTTSNFDEIIPANQIVDLVVPVDTTTGALFTTTRVIERAATATLVVIQK